MALFVGALLFITVGLVALVALIQRKAAPEPYHPLFAEAPDPDPVAPRVIVGSDLDLSDARVNLIFAVQVMPYAEDAKQYAAGLLGLYVVPEVER